MWMMTRQAFGVIRQALVDHARHVIGRQLSQEKRV